MRGPGGDSGRVLGSVRLYPPPGPDFVISSVGVDRIGHTIFTGFAAHWNKNTNAAWAFDTWFLNLFPRSKPFAFNGGGYATLSFIPTLGTMILGLIAGDWLRKPGEPAAKWQSWSWPGAVPSAVGLALHYTGVCPIVKRIWTPSWTLASGGATCFLILAGFYVVIDGVGFRAWSFPLRVIGMNSIAAYMMAHLFDDFVVHSFKTHLGKDFFQFPIGTGLEPFFTGVAVLVVYWLILFWMYRQKFFVKI